MNVTQERLILDGVDAAMACHETGLLPDMLGELAVRLELAGAGGLLAVLINTDPDLIGRVRLNLRTQLEPETGQDVRVAVVTYDSKPRPKAGEQ